MKSAIGIGSLLQVLPPPCACSCRDSPPAAQAHSKARLRRRRPARHSGPFHSMPLLPGAGTLAASVVGRGLTDWAGGLGRTAWATPSESRSPRIPGSSLTRPASSVPSPTRRAARRRLRLRPRCRRGARRRGTSRCSVRATGRCRCSGPGTRWTCGASSTGTALCWPRSPSSRCRPQQTRARGGAAGRSGGGACGGVGAEDPWLLAAYVRRTRRRGEGAAETV